MPTILPPISIIIPTLNEAGFIVDCIKSITNGSYPVGNIEIIVVDGGSEDSTLKQVQDLAKTDLDIVLLTNPKKITPAAMNIGIKAAKNDLLMWCGAHALYDCDYVLNSVTTLLDEPQAASVGGVISPVAKTATGKAIAIATSSRFGIGNAQYRYAAKRQYVDTVFGGCFFKKSLSKVGGFNEAWVRNQDYELNHRLRSQIGQIILEPSIRCQYYCRETISKLSKQYFDYGFWRFNTLLEHRTSFSYRQAAPLVLFFSLLASLVLIALSSSIGWLVPLIYLTACLAVSIKITFEKKQTTLMFYLPFTFPAIHISWGAGFAKNLIVTITNKAFKQIK